MSLRFFLDNMLLLWKSNTQWPLFDCFGNWYLGQVENTYKGPSSSSSLIWTSEFFSPKSGLVKACGAFLPLLSLLRIFLRFDWMRGPWRWRTGSGSLTHPSVFPVSVTGNRGEGDTNTVNNSVVTCLLQNRFFIAPLSMQCSPFPTRKRKSHSKSSGLGVQYADLTQVPSLCQKELVASFYEISMHLQSFIQIAN